jgi:AcrR family transcriptional regulator
MSPKTKEQNQLVREERKASIMEAALEVFAEKGFETASISLIAKRAKISKGLIYNYFESKEELIKEIMFSGIEQFVPEIDLNRTDAISKEEFTYLIIETFNILQRNLIFWRLYFSVFMQPAVLKLVEEKLMETLIPFINILYLYYQNKGVENPMAHARLLGAIFDGVSLNYIMDPENVDLEEIKKIIVEKFV